MVIGMANHPSKAKEKLLYLVPTTNEKKAQIPDRQPLDSEGNIFHTAEYCFDSLTKNYRGCWLRMEPRARSSSRLSSGYSVSSPDTWAIQCNRRCAIRSINGGKRCHVKFMASLNRGIRMYIPRFVDQDHAACGGELYTT